MANQKRDVGASILARLNNLARQTGQSHQQLIIRFVLERLLYRLGQSEYGGRFVLKGGMLLTNWFAEGSRMTKDVDFLGYVEPDEEALRGIFQEVLAMQCDDGVTFDADAIETEAIREGAVYHGIRLTTRAFIGKSPVAVTVDIGFGDDPQPAPVIIGYPSLLDFPKPRLKAYAMETVIAEKFHAIVSMGVVNSRMKDFYDIFMLGKSYSFDDGRLSQSIAATFARRKDSIPTELPEALTQSFAADARKQQQWQAFSNKLADDNVGTLDEVVKAVGGFIMPHAIAAATRSSSRRS